MQLLIEGLGHPSAEVRLAACEALLHDMVLREELEKHPAVGPLVHCLRDDDPRVRAAAARALGFAAIWAMDPEPQPWDHWVPNHMTTAPDEAIPSLVHALSDSDLHVRVRAAQTLARSRHETQLAAVPALIEGLRGDDRDLRRAAVAALYRVGPAAAAAIPALRDEPMRERTHWEDTWVRADTARALSRVAPAEEGIPILLRAWSETKMYPVQLIWAIGSYSTADPQVVPFLVEAASKGHPRAKDAKEVRELAVRALGSVRPVTREAVSAVIEYAVGPDLHLRWAALDALEHIGKADDRVVPALLTVAQLADRDGQHRGKALDIIDAPRAFRLDSPSLDGVVTQSQCSCALPIGGNAG